MFENSTAIDSNFYGTLYPCRSKMTVEVLAWQINPSSADGDSTLQLIHIIHNFGENRNPHVTVD